MYRYNTRDLRALVLSKYYCLRLLLYCWTYNIILYLNLSVSHFSLGSHYSYRRPRSGKAPISIVSTVNWKYDITMFPRRRLDDCLEPLTDNNNSSETKYWLIFLEYSCKTLYTVPLSCFEVRRLDAECPAAFKVDKSRCVRPSGRS